MVRPYTRSLCFIQNKQHLKWRLTSIVGISASSAYVFYKQNLNNFVSYVNTYSFPQSLRISFCIRLISYIFFFLTDFTFFKNKFCKRNTDNSETNHFYNKLACDEEFPLILLSIFLLHLHKRKILSCYEMYKCIYKKIIIMIEGKIWLTIREFREQFSNIHVFLVTAQ